MPELADDVDRKIDLDQEVRASGFIKDALGDNVDKAFNDVTEEHMTFKQETNADDEEEEDSSDEQESGEENNEDGAE